MIPTNVSTLLVAQEEEQPSYTYKWDEETNRIIGNVDGYQAVLQFVRKVLTTERYGHVIYSSEYGSDVNNMIGQDYDYISADLERVIKEALMSDGRVSGVEDFTIEKSSTDTLTASFLVVTVDGSIPIETEVII